MATLIGQAGNGVGADERSLRILARTLFKELKLNGYDSRQIVALSTELIGLVTSDIRSEPEVETFISAHPSA